MSEQVLKVQLGELLQTVRLRRADGIVIEAAGCEAARDYCARVRESDPHAYEVLTRFFALAAQISDPSFPVQVEFAAKAS